eukprot:TRINITY_DN3396_c0_g1_i1.p1 TRINITY_DN3396_c0_g1~~TRINITY_DN3396_c0_g1_i1.p1  ORF type:complete len:400 (-),score=79.85 TRINITY_DN3396_c0_g1_i1:239-1438(-)
MEDIHISIFAVSFHSDQFWILLEKKADSTQSAIAEYDHFTTDKGNAYNSLSAAQFLQSHLQSILRDSIDASIEITTNEKDTLASVDQRIYLVLLPSLIGNEAVNRALQSKGILSTPLFSHLAQCLDLQRMCGQVNLGVKEISTMTSVFQSDTPMYRYLSQLSTTSLPDFITSDLSQRQLDFIDTRHEALMPRKPSSSPSLLSESAIRTMTSTEALKLVHSLFASYSVLNSSLGETKKSDGKHSNQSAIDLSTKDWSLRESTWVEMKRVYDENQQPLCHQAQETLKHIEHLGILELGRIIFKDADAPRPMPTLKTINTLCEILPGLYLSNVITASNSDLLHEKGITHILRVLQGNQRCAGFTYAVISVEDQEENNLLHYFEAAKLFIDAGRRAGGCLVHW